MRGNGRSDVSVVVGHSAWNDLQLIGGALEEAGIAMLSVVSSATDLADQARSLGADCALFSPTLPGMNPGLIQELLVDPDRPIAGVGLIPAGSAYAAEYQQFGMKGFVSTPLDAMQIQRLPDLVCEAVRLAASEREARSFTPVTAQDALSILDRGGWQQQTIAVWSPKGGVGKSTISTNLAAAFGAVAQRPTLLVDADMSRANLHVLLGVDIEAEPRNLFALFERVLAQGSRTGRYPVSAQVLQANVRPWAGKLHLLPGIPKMHMAGRSEFVEDPDRTMGIFSELLAQARGYYEFRVVDTGPDFNLPLHWAAIQQADAVLLVVTPERTGLDDVKNSLPMLEQAFGTLTKFKIVLNGFDEQFGIDPKEVVKYLGGRVPIIGTLPYAPTETRLAINQGQPLATQKKLAPAGAALQRLAAHFYPPLEALERKGAKSRGVGLFDRVRELLVEA